VHLPPYSFMHPVRDAARSASAVTPVSAPETGGQNVAPAELARVQQIVTQLEDERAIEILQRTYGYFVDKNLRTQIADLFTEDGTLEIGGRGVFVGRQRIVRYLQWQGDPLQKVTQGRLYDHTQMQPVIHVAPDGLTAKGRWRAMVFGGDYGGRSIFGDCIYENEYRKVKGVWQISKLHAYFVMYSDLESGWGVRATPNTRPDAAVPPDLPPTVVYDMYPGVITAPLHYENPVTGKPVFAPIARIPAATESPVKLAERLGRLEDARAIEYLHNAYGYYLDRWQWDDVAALFAADGTIEYAQRGVYVGKQHIRQSLELFGAQGLHQQEVFDHPQYQPVVHVAADGNSAKARVREFGMEGKFGVDAAISGGVYENEYVKEGGVWKIKSLHLHTTFIADLTKGWSAGPRPAPGADATLRPDQPPSVRYQSFPLYHMAPFHYPHPVTGQPVID
jgi:SnoaL-like domain